LAFELRASFLNALRVAAVGVKVTPQ